MNTKRWIGNRAFRKALLAVMPPIPITHGSYDNHVTQAKGGRL